MLLQLFLDEFLSAKNSIKQISFTPGRKVRREEGFFRLKNSRILNASRCLAETFSRPPAALVSAEDVETALGSFAFVRKIR